MKSPRKKFSPQLVNGIPEITPHELKNFLQESIIIDVRSQDEFVGELGHVPGAKLVTLGDQLIKFLDGQEKDQEIVFVCRSGLRSGTATQQSLQMGFHLSVNLSGGMLLWNKLCFPVEK